MVKKQPPQIVSLPLVVDHGRLTLHGHPAPVNLRIRDKRRAAQNDEQQRNALRRDQRAVDNAFRDAAQKREEILQRLRRLRGKFLRRKLVAVEIARIVKVPVVDRQGFFVDRPLDRPLDLLLFPPEVKILVHRVEQIERQREQKVCQARQKCRFKRLSRFDHFDHRLRQRRGKIPRRRHKQHR